MYIHVYINIYIGTSGYAWDMCAAYIHIYINIYTYIYIYIHIHKYTYTYIYIYRHIRICVRHVCCICGTWLISMCGHISTSEVKWDMSHENKRQIQDKWILSFVRHDSFLCVDTWGYIRETCLMRPTKSFIRGTWLTNEIFICGTWLISMCRHIGTSENTWDMSSHVSAHRISTSLGTSEDTAHQDLLHLWDMTHFYEDLLL